MGVGVVVPDTFDSGVSVTVAAMVAVESRLTVADSSASLGGEDWHATSPIASVQKRTTPAESTPNGNRFSIVALRIATIMISGTCVIAVSATDATYLWHRPIYFSMSILSTSTHF